VALCSRLCHFQSGQKPCDGCLLPEAGSLTLSHDVIWGDDVEVLGVDQWSLTQPTRWERIQSNPAHSQNRGIQPALLMGITGHRLIAILCQITTLIF